MYEAQVSCCFSFILLLFFPINKNSSSRLPCWHIFFLYNIFHLPVITTSSSHKFVVIETVRKVIASFFFCFNFNCIKNSSTKIRNVENDNFHMTRRHFTTNEGDNWIRVESKPKTLCDMLENFYFFFWKSLVTCQLTFNVRQQRLPPTRKIWMWKLCNLYYK